MASPSTSAVARGDWRVIPLTLLLALLLTVLPYPEWMHFARPDWVTLVLFYWCLALPQRVGVGTGWVLGLLLDLLQYTLFGQHAIGKALVALVAVGAHRRLRLCDMWQQCAVVLALSAVDTAIVMWVWALSADAALRPDYWLGALSTALLWPLVYVVLRKVRRRSGMLRR